LWERIAQTKAFHANDPDIDRMRGVLDRWPASRLEGHGAIAWALSKAMVDIGDDEAAAHLLESRAAVNRTRFRFRPDLLTAVIADIERWCETQGAASDTAPIEGSERPIFVLGPARSGTTLVDLIFSRHPSVRGGGEL
jgi:hypothetical protein